MARSLKDITNELEKRISIEREKAREASGQDKLDMLADIVFQLAELKSVVKEHNRNTKDRIVDISGCPKEGTETIETKRYKISRTGRIRRNVSVERLRELYDELSEEITEDQLEDIFSVKVSVLKSGLNNVESVSPESYRRITSSVISQKEGTPGVSVEEK